MAWQVFSWIAQTLASSALAILAFIAVRSTAIGERFLNYRLEQKIVALERDEFSLNRFGIPKSGGF